MKVQALFSDLQKDFDNLSHHPLSDKLCNINLPVHLISCQLQVSIEDVTFTPSKHISGMSQGPIWGPLRSLIYIDGFVTVSAKAVLLCLQMTPCHTRILDFLSMQHDIETRLIETIKQAGLL